MHQPALLCTQETHVTPPKNAKSYRYRCKNTSPCILSRRLTCTLSLLSPSASSCFYLCILPAFLQTPLQERKRAREGVPNTDTFLLPPPSSLSFCLSLKTTAVIPNACQGATELVSVHVDVCAASGPDQDTHSLCCWLRFLPVNCQEILKHAI